MTVIGNRFTPAFAGRRPNEPTPAPPGPTLTLDPALTVIDGRRIAGRLLAGGAESIVADWGDGTPREPLAAPWAFEHTYAEDAIYHLRAIATSAEGRTSVETVNVTARGDPTGGPGPDVNPYRDAVLVDGPVAYYRLGDPATGGFAIDQCGGPPAAFSPEGVVSPLLNLLGVVAAGASTQFLTGEARIEGHPGVEAIADEWTVETLMIYDGGAYKTICQSDNIWFGLTVATPTNLYLFNRGSGGNIELDASLPAMIPTHLAWTADNGQHRVYLNGAPVFAGALEDPEQGEEEEGEALAPTMCVIGRAIGGDNPFAYPLQEWALYPHVLAPARIAAHAAAGGFSAVPPPDPDPEP